MTQKNIYKQRKLYFVKKAIFNLLYNSAVWQWNHNIRWYSALDIFLILSSMYINNKVIY